MLKQQNFQYEDRKSILGRNTKHIPKITSVKCISLQPEVKFYGGEVKGLTTLKRAKFWCTTRAPPTLPGGH